ncbi:hypothetical protein ANO11243_048890 [Dothideomycetidae sp. 11243]|nr:hypothetical protein ANO11243_048890 [fungal sp. No.11243]
MKRSRVSSEGNLRGTRGNKEVGSKIGSRGSSPEPARNIDPTLMGLPAELLAQIMRECMAQRRYFVIHSQPHYVKRRLYLTEVDAEYHLTQCLLGQHHPPASGRLYRYFDGPVGVNAQLYNETIRLFYRNNTFHFMYLSSLIDSYKKLPRDLFKEISAVVVHTTEAPHYWEESLPTQAMPNKRWLRVVRILSSLPHLQSLILHLNELSLPNVGLRELAESLQPITVSAKHRPCFAVRFHWPQDMTRTRLAAEMVSAGLRTDFALSCGDLLGAGDLYSIIYFQRHDHDCRHNQVWRAVEKILWRGRRPFVTGSPDDQVQ